MLLWAGVHWDALFFMTSIGFQQLEAKCIAGLQHGARPVSHLESFAIEDSNPAAWSSLADQLQGFRPPLDT